jgi:hypothetical protein
MKNKSTKKRTTLKIVLALVVIAGVLVFLLPSRCGNESSETVSSQPDDISFESGSSAWVEPERADNRAERYNEAPPTPLPLISPMDTGSSGAVETSEKPVMIETGRSEQIDEAGIVPAEQKTDKDMDPSVIPVAAIAEAERTAAAIPVIGETVRGQSANIQAKEAKAAPDKPANEAVTDKSANGAVTETADKNKIFPPEVVVKKIDAVPPKAEVSTGGAEMPETPSGKIETESPKVESAKNADFMPELSRESLKTTVGTSKETAALDVKSVSGAGNTSTVQRATPSSAGNEGLITKSTLPPPKDTTSKNIERVPVTSPESQKVTTGISQEVEKSGALVPETKHEQEITKDEAVIPASASDKAEPPQTNFESRGKTEQKTAEKVGGFSAGVLFEGNRATREGWGMEAGLIVGYEITGSLSAGIKGAYGTDFSGIEYFEGLLYGRYYLPFRKEEFGIFAQLGVGGITVTEARERTLASMMLDISLGARFFLGNFYIEPYVRAGFLIQAGAGLAFGYRLEG